MSARRRYASLLRLAISRPELEPDPLIPRPHDFAVLSLVVIRHATGERRELDPRAWPSYEAKGGPS